jgi:hypothetical protein
MKNNSKIIEKIENSDSWKNDDTVVELKLKQPLEKVIPVRLSSDQWQHLYAEAKTLGIGPTTLARMWLIEKLQAIIKSNRINGILLEQRALGRNLRGTKSELHVSDQERDFLVWQSLMEEFGTQNFVESLNNCKTLIDSLLGDISEKSDSLNQKVNNNP